jgi:hypothetical protein
MKMQTWTAHLQASKTGALTLYTQSRTFTVKAIDVSQAIEAAILKAYQEGLEHVRVTKVTRLTA